MNTHPLSRTAGVPVSEDQSAFSIVGASRGVKLHISIAASFLYLRFWTND